MQVVVVGVHGHDAEAIAHVVAKAKDLVFTHSMLNFLNQKIKKFLYLEAPRPCVDDVVQRPPLRPDAAAAKFAELDLEELSEKSVNSHKFLRFYIFFIS